MKIKVLVLSLAKSGSQLPVPFGSLRSIVTVNDVNLLKKIQQHKSLLEEGIKVVTGGHLLELCWMTQRHTTRPAPPSLSSSFLFAKKPAHGQITTQVGIPFLYELG